MAKINRIDGESRFYEVEGVGKFPSVTTILGVIAKPALIGWAKKMVALAIEPTLKGIKDGSIPLDSIDVELILKNAKANPKEVTEEAGDIGTQVHKHLEDIVKNKIANPQIEWNAFEIAWNETSNDLPIDKRVVSCVDAFFKWAIEVDFKPVVSELMVYSKKLGYAGTLDTAGIVNGVLSVIDFKSSKAYYDEMGIQISAYRHAYAEMTKAKRVDGMMILRLGKEDGEFEVIKVNNAPQNMLAFKGALALWKWKQNNTEKN